MAKTSPFWKPRRARLVATWRTDLARSAYVRVRPVGPSIRAGLFPRPSAPASTKVGSEISGMSTSGYELRKITCAPASAPRAQRRVPLQQVARNRTALDFVRSLVDPVDTNVAHHALDGHLFGVAHAAVDLHHPVDDPPDHAGTRQLRDRRLVPSVAALVRLPGGVEPRPLHLPRP